MIIINNVIWFTTLVFLIGLFGTVFNRKNLIMLLLSIELIYLSINLNYSIFSVYLDDILGQIFVLFILTIAAAESAIVLSLIIKLYKYFNCIDFENIKESSMKL